MPSDPQNRDSGFELLRIVAVFMIIAYHLLLHGVVPDVLQANFLMKSLLSTLHIGAVCFVLISGYWGIRFSLRGLLRFVSICVFYSVAIYGVHAGLHPEDFSIRALFSSIIPFDWWFVQIYLSLYLLSPWINQAIIKSTAGEKLFHIVLLLLVSSVVGMGVPGLRDGKNPINFILIYYLGNYIQHQLTGNHPTKRMVWQYTVFNLLILGVFFSTTSFPQIQQAVFLKGFFSYNSLGLLFNAVLFFMIFTTLRFHSRLVNYLAGSVLGVYLFHENDFLSRYLHDYIRQLHFATENPLVFSSYILLITLAVFFAGVFLDKILSPMVYYCSDRLAVTPAFRTMEKHLSRWLVA